MRDQSQNIGSDEKKSTTIVVPGAGDQNIIHVCSVERPHFHATKLSKRTYLLLGDLVDLLLWVAGADLEDVDHALLERVEAADLADDGADLLDTLGSAL